VTPVEGRLPDPVEQYLTERAAGRDEQAFTELVRRHQDQLYRVALRMTDDPGTAEDVVQEALLQAWQHLAGFRAEARFATWVTRIVINGSLNVRRGPSRPAVPGEDLSADELPASPAAEEEAMRRQQRAAVQQAVASLPFDQRAVLVLTAFAGYTHTETGQILGISQTAAKVRAHRARQALAARLQQWR
jgi:RNA polymerase sigma-70 factor (ECF subfamily)